MGNLFKLVGITQTTNQLDQSQFEPETTQKQEWIFYVIKPAARKKIQTWSKNFCLINCSLFLLVKYPCALVKKRKFALVEKKKKICPYKMFQYVIQLTENCVLIHVQSKSLLCSDSMFYCLSKWICKNLLL